MQEWRTTSDLWRTWTRFDGGARWLLGDGSNLARTGAGAPISLVSPAMRSRAARLNLAHGAELAQVVAGDAHAAWYVHALLAVMCIECPTGKLPCYGDWRALDDPSKVVNPNTTGARPLSVGLYQFTRGTATSVGTTWEKLASDAVENHRAALRLAKRLEPQHQHDFPTLAVLWNAGSIRQDVTNTWGVHLWSKDLLTDYVRAFVAVGEELRRPSSSAGGGGGVLLAALGAWALL